MIITIHLLPLLLLLLITFLRILGSHLYPRIKSVIFWLDRIQVPVIVKVIDCYQDNRRSIKLFRKVDCLFKEIGNTIDRFLVTCRCCCCFFISPSKLKNTKIFTLQKAKLSIWSGALRFSNRIFPWKVSSPAICVNATQSWKSVYRETTDLLETHSEFQLARLFPPILF